MSNVSTVYDTILAAIASLFTSKTRIPNAYSLQDNDDYLLRDGYGLKIGGASPASSDFQAFKIDREFIVVFSLEVPRVDTQTDIIDTKSKEILENIYTLQRKFYNPERMTIPAYVENITLGSIGGIEYVISNKSNFISMEASFTFSIRETI